MDVCIVNESTAFKDSDLPSLVSALQTQVSAHFGPHWGSEDTKITSVSKSNVATSLPRIDPTLAQLILLDTSDQAGALGYHDLTSAGMPIGKAFVGDDLKYGVYASQTISHELLEMLADPSINATYIYGSGKKAYLLACEVCDPVEDARQAYQINGVWVSDFVFPSWFGFDANMQYDYTKALTKPQQIAVNGYIGKYSLSTRHWTTIGASFADSPQAKQKIRNAKVGSRRDKRYHGIITS